MMRLFDTLTRLSGRRSRFLFCIIQLTVGSAAIAADAPFAAAVITGSSHFDAVELADTWRGHLGEPISDERVASVVAALEQLYTDAGHRAPAVLLDRRFLERGILRLIIDEGDSLRIEISGSAGPYDALAREWLDELRYASADRDAMRYVIRRIQRLPGVEIKARLAGPARLQVELGFRALESALYATNRGVEEIGANIFAARLRINSLAPSLGVLDASASTSSSPDLYSATGVRLTRSVGGDRSQLRIAAGHSEARPNVDGLPGTAVHKRQRASFGVSRRMADTTDTDWSVGFEIASLDLQVDDQGTRLRDEKTRSIELQSVTSLRRSSDVRYFADVYYRQGIDGLGAQLVTTSTSPELRELDFWLAGFELRRLSRIGDDWRLDVSLAGQYTDSILPSSHRYRIGGRSYGRAYELAEVSGDSGASVALEVGRYLALAPRVLPNLMAYAFYDAGAVWPDDYSGRVSAASGGIGFRLRSSTVRAYLEFAKPLTLSSEIGGDGIKTFGGLSIAF